MHLCNSILILIVVLLFLFFGNCSEYFEYKRNKNDHDELEYAF